MSTPAQPPASAPATRRPLIVALLGAVFIGMLTAIQARINGQLGLRLENGMVAAFVSFGSGLVVMLLITAVLPSGRRGVLSLIDGLRSKTIPPWMLFGGAAGALTVATQGLTVGIIGVSLFTVGILAGQAVCGLVLDRIGFGPAGKVAVSTARLIGGALALAAVGISLSGDVLSNTAWWMLLLPFGSGMGIAWQQATNGRLGARVGTALTATLMNFVGGSILLAIGALVSLGLNGPTAVFPTEPWLYSGGTLGVIYIFLSTAIVGKTGVLLLGLGSVVGQITTSSVIDLIWPATHPSDAFHTSAMVTLALASVVIAAVPWRRRR